jgi:putative transposase
MLKKEFRMTLINRLKDLTPKERSKLIDEIIQGRHSIPLSAKTSISKTTIYRWLNAFNKCVDAGTVLLGKVRTDKETFKALTEEQMNALKRWRYDNPYRSAEDLRDELMEHESTTTERMPSLSTICRFLKANHLSRFNLIYGNKPQGKIRIAFEAEYPQQIWMADTKGPDVYVIDPKNPSNQVLAKPISFIDDNSRYSVAINYVIEENEAAVMALFFQAILLYGIPEILLVDRGSPYAGKSLKRAANLIGCNIIHTAPRDPEAKGKQERVLRTFHERFEHEMMVTGKTTVRLEEYNRYLQAYIAQDYNQKIHSSTNQTPEERFFAFPAKHRRWISKSSLMMVFLPCKTASVSKTGLVRINNLKYMVGDMSLWQQKVEVRYELQDTTRIYVWHDDKYYGEANVFTESNDYLQREAIKEKLSQAPTINLPNIESVPIYGRLERQLAQHREELSDLNINDQIIQNKTKKELVRASLSPGNPSIPSDNATIATRVFEVDDFLYLLTKLMRVTLTPSERLIAHTLWRSLGPIDENLVRNTVGRMLGKEHPTSDVKGYLEEIRLCILTKHTGD